MTLLDLITRARRNLNDKDSSIYERDDIVSYVNEAIDRMKDIYVFQNEVYLSDNLDELDIIPTQYQYLLAVYATARCFSLDEQYYQATTFMNEFEVKRQEMIDAIESGELTVTDSLGVAITFDYESDAVENVYFDYGSTSDLFGSEDEDV